MTIQRRLTRDAWKKWLAENKNVPNMGALFLADCFKTSDPELEQLSGTEAERVIEHRYVESDQEDMLRTAYSGLMA